MGDVLLKGMGHLIKEGVVCVIMSEMGGKTEIYNFIVCYMQREGFPPTQREISDHTDVSARRVRVYLEELEQDGLIKRRWHASRAVKLCNYRLVVKS